MEYLHRRTEAHDRQPSLLCSNGTLCQLIQMYHFKRLIDHQKTLLLFHARNCQENKDPVQHCVLLPSQNSANWSNQNRKRSGRPRCTTEQEDKYIRGSSLRNRCLTSPQLAASLNSTRKLPVSTSTVTRRLRDSGLLCRVAKKKPYLRLAN